MHAWFWTRKRTAASVRRGTRERCATLQPALAAVCRVCAAAVRRRRMERAASASPGSRGRAAMQVSEEPGKQIQISRGLFLKDQFISRGCKKFPHLSGSM